MGDLEYGKGKVTRSSWPRSTTLSWPRSTVLTVVLSAGLLAVVAWAVSGGPVSTHIVALVKKPAKYPSLEGSAPPTADTLRTYKAGLLQAYLQGFQQTFQEEDWQRFLPVIRCPKDRPLTKYGQGDGSKLLCRAQALGSKADGSPCIIYSLGSNGDYQFENAMLKATSCNLYTFDCTFDGQSVDDNKRHHYYKWCIGKGAENWKTWPEITASLKHSSVDLLKMDVEGHEYPVLAGFKPSDALPEEISIELHTKFANGPSTPAELAFVFLHMANLGYVAYAQEVNEFGPHCCSEFTFMRVANTSDCNK